MNAGSPTSLRKARWFFPLSGILAGVLLLLGFTGAHAHGIVGNRIFLSPVVGNDAFPDNAFGLAGRGSDYEFSLLPALEKQLSDHSSLLFVGGWEHVTPRGRRRTVDGFSDLAIYYRQAVYISVSHELELTISPLLEVPVGTRRIADQGFCHLGGEALLGKGFGDLPDSPLLRYLRPFALQAEFGHAGRIQGPANSDLVANLELEYSLQYLDRFVQRLDSARPLVELIPYVQFNYAQALMVSHLTTKPDFRLTPGVAFLGEYCEVSAGAQVALNGAAPRGGRVGAIGLVEIFYDNIFPALGWQPF